MLLLWNQAWEYENPAAAWVWLKEPDGEHLSPKRNTAEHQFTGYIPWDGIASWKVYSLTYLAELIKKGHSAETGLAQWIERRPAD